MNFWRSAGNPGKGVSLSYKKLFFCIPDKDIHVFYLDRQFLSHPCYLTQGRKRVFKALVVKEVTYQRRQVTLVLTAVTSK